MLELAKQLKDANSLMFFARGNNYATALEAALKVRAGYECFCLLCLAHSALLVDLCFAVRTRLLIARRQGLQGASGESVVPSLDRAGSAFACRCFVLQCKEVALIHSEGILAGEMKHGPLALVDEHLPIVVVATRDSMYAKMESVIQQLLARNAKLVIVCTAGDENMKQYVEGHDCKLIEVRWGALVKLFVGAGRCILVESTW